MNGQFVPDARPLDANNIHFEEAFSFRGWQIILVETDVSDDMFLFFRDDPSKSSPVTSWGGAATIFEEQSIFRRTKKKCARNTHPFGRMLRLVRNASQAMTIAGVTKQSLPRFGIVSQKSRIMHQK